MAQVFDTSNNGIDYNMLQMIDILRSDCIDLQLSEIRTVDVIYSQLRMQYDISINHIIDNILMYYEIEAIDGYQDIERYLNGIANFATINPINIIYNNDINYDADNDDDDDEEDENIEEEHDIFDDIDDIILENGNHNIRFTRIIVNAVRNLPGTNPPPSTNNISSPVRENRFEDVKVILQKKELEKFPATKYETLSNDVKIVCTKCTVCLDDYDDNSYVRQMECNHIFHKKCIDKWLLEYNYKCPMCRSECGSYEPKL